jgi:signal peptidase II
LARKLPKHFVWIATAISVGVLVLDQVTKYIIADRLPVNGVPITMIEGFFYISHEVNTGAAWGIFNQHMGRLAFVSFVVALILIVYFRKFAEGYTERGVAFAMLLGGILGNLVDRMDLIKRPSGIRGVVDFLRFILIRYHYPSFNVADIGITVGVGIVLISSFCRKPPEEEGDGKDDKRTWGEKLKDALRP